MNIIKCKMPEGNDNYEDCELTDSELEQIESAEAIIYWYGSGYYEGRGCAFISHNAKWYFHDMGHCSCYGPLDYFHYKGGKDSPLDFYNEMSDEAKKDVELLIEAYVERMI